jgi:Mce-associated membrane protein
VTTPQADSPAGATSGSHDTSVQEAALVPVDADTEQTAESANEEVGESTDTVEEVPEETAEAVDAAELDEGGTVRRRVSWSRVLAFGVLPTVALVLAMAAGFFRWQDSSVRDADVARVESVQAAKDSTTALLSYKPESVEQRLGAARDRLTGDFRDSYTSLIHDVVIPGAKQKQISAVATVPAAASASASLNRAVVLVFVNQSVIVGNDAPTETASSVKVTLDKVGGHWLISGFDPV